MEVVRRSTDVASKRCVRSARVQEKLYTRQVLSDLLTGFMRLSTLLFLAIASLSGHAEESPYDPPSQAHAHAAIWTVWNKHHEMQCEAKLTNKPAVESPLKAAENLLYQLAGAEIHEIQEEKIPAIVTWNEIEELSPEMRKQLAYRMDRMGDMFWNGRQYRLAFGHVVRGEQAIQEYTNSVRTEFAKIHPELVEERNGLVELDRTATWQRIKTHAFPMLVPSALAAYVSYMIYPHPVSAAVGGAIGFLPNFKIPLVLSPVVLKVRWDAIRGIRVPALQKRTYKTNAESSPVFNRAIEAENFFVEQESLITANAFDALRRNAEEARNELLRSCRLQSADCPTQEEAAHLDMINVTNAYGVPGMMMKMVSLSRKEERRGHIGETVPVKLIAARFRDSQTGEPVLLHWITFNLMPPHGNSKKPKEQTATEKGWSGEGRWAPVPVPKPAGR
jgi:hypothetical protein